MTMMMNNTTSFRKVTNLTSFQVRTSLNKARLHNVVHSRKEGLVNQSPIFPGALSAEQTSRDFKSRNAPLKIDLTHVMVKSNLDLISNEHLSRFIINEGKDNALT